MTRAPSAAAVAALLALAAVACGGSDPAPAPATEPPGADTATPPVTESPPATEAAPATPTAEPPAATATAAPPEPVQEGEVPLEIVTLLLPDAIPAIDRPRIISAEEGDAQLRLSDVVIGVSIDGQHRAYGAAFLSAHEIVNDTLGGRPIAVTW